MEIKDAESLAEKHRYDFTYSKLVVLLGGVFIALFLFSLFLAKTLLVSLFDPAYENQQLVLRLSTLSTAVDSLEKAALDKDIYIQNIQDIIDGKVDETGVQSKEGTAATIQSSSNNLMEISAADSSFRNEFTKVESANSVEKQISENVFFFPPINGVISKEFNIVERHFGTDLVAKANEPIKSVADGTVILSSWTQDSGYVIGVQHKNEIISFYKHNSTLLKKVGERVRAGDIIAIIGNSGELTDGPHLHFEIWYKGSPANPANFIAFD
ncbi:M23 family metallopeptidase [Algivirga pacifica]|uniref:M23 family metallopeptidase n=1 Tax=Algivirga pacifica TaxID=1162670 RepID=A0ABP9DNS9_9BACT